MQRRVNYAKIFLGLGPGPDIFSLNVLYALVLAIRLVTLNFVYRRIGSWLKKIMTKRFLTTTNPFQESSEQLRKSLGPTSLDLGERSERCEEAVGRLTPRARRYQVKRLRVRIPTFFHPKSSVKMYLLVSSGYGSCAWDM